MNTEKIRLRSAGQLSPDWRYDAFLSWTKARSEWELGANKIEPDAIFV
jgi:hypothetical protein